MIQWVKNGNLPAMQESWVRSLCREDPLEKEMATYSSILAWGIPMDCGALWVTVHRVAKGLVTTKATYHALIQIPNSL